MFVILYFRKSAVWLSQDFHDNKLTATLSDSGDGCSGDSCVLIFSSARVNNEALHFLPSLSLSLSVLYALGQNIAFPPVALWVTVGLAVCLLVLLIALAAVCSRKIKESCEEARREGRGNKRERLDKRGEMTLHI